MLLDDGIFLLSVYCGDAGWLPVVHKNNSILEPVCPVSSIVIINGERDKFMLIS